MTTLPERYCNSMKRLLGEEYQEYIDSFCQDSYTAFRVNTRKISLDKWNKINPFPTKKVAWTQKGFYFDAKKEKPSKHPYYYAGLYYIQEPSAMIPASILPVSPEDKVLDLCAAPGGKATELGAKLGQGGLLVANDISVSRTVALAKNLQMAGISNAIVTAETPQHLAEVFEGFFDKILIDAPCSGEGMFRREPRMVKDWMEKGPEYYSQIQTEILERAYQMLCDGGMLVYSTCTFSVLEDEAVIKYFLEKHFDMSVCCVERKSGFREGRPDLVDGPDELKNCIRIFPHCADGEGHFAVLLQKGKNQQKENCVQEDVKNRYEHSFAPDRMKKECERVLGEAQKECSKKVLSYKTSASKKRQKDRAGKEIPSKKARKEKAEEGTKVSMDVLEQAKEVIMGLPYMEGKLTCQNGRISMNPLLTEKLNHLRIVHSGVGICELKHKLSMSHELALMLHSKDFEQVIDLQAKDEQVIRFLKGETLLMETPYKGNILVCVDGYGLGWCQGNGKGMLKNKYFAGWRYQ